MRNDEIKPSKTGQYWIKLASFGKKIKNRKKYENDVRDK